MNERVRRFFSFWKEQGTGAVVRLVRAKLGRAVAGRPILGGGEAAAAINAVDPIVKANDVTAGYFLAIQPLETFLIPASSTRRISLITDSIGRGSLFGGVGTAMLLAAQLANRLSATLRIVTRTEEPSPSNVAQILGAYGIELTHEVQFAFLPPVVSGLEVASEKPQTGPAVPGLDIHPDELFITTSWWTTAATLPSVPRASIIYLLQEDERMFYPFGEQRVQCERVLSTQDIRFVINTQLLYDHLIASGLENLNRSASWFEPAFPKTLFHERERVPGEKKRFFFYARQNNPRNLFHIGLDVIDRAINQGVLDLNEWEVFLVGKDIPNVTFGDGYVPQRCEGLEWKAYADLAGTIDLGLSLMYTPHPSYPPLDLAASGAIVVTNKFANKQDLSNYSRNIICAELDTEALVEALRTGVALAEDQQTRSRNFSANALGADWAAAFEETLQLLTAAR